jgi:hypothetical protein
MAKVHSIAPSEHKSVSIREISNGFLTCESGCGPNGEYYSKDTYSPTRPKVELVASTKPRTAAAGRASAPRSSLAGAVGMLKGSHK